MAWTNTGGGDHEGDNWTPADTLTIAGVHYNIGTFTVTTGYTINISTGVELSIYADTVSVVGTIEATGDGLAGGAGRGGSLLDGYAGSGTGAGGGGEKGRDEDDTCTGGGGGGAGYGGVGAVGEHGGCPFSSDGGSAGITYGVSNDYKTYLGSGGGSGGTGWGAGCASGAGGKGGGVVLLLAEDLTVTGTINVNGADGGTGGGSLPGGGGGGGGSGGTILLLGDTVVLSGTFNSYGGTGGNGYGPGTPDGGAGGGGRIKVFYTGTLNTSGITTSVIAGTGYGTGGAGTYTTQRFNSCTSSIPLGQEFTLGSTGIAIISQIKLYVDTVNTSGDFILKVWDSTSKNTEYATKTLTISGTGETAFDFDGWFRLPDGTQTYYIELTTAGAGDIDIAVDGNSTFAGGDMYHDGLIAVYVDLYHKVYTIGDGYPHIISAVVYNTADTTVKCNVINEMLLGSIHRINENNTGTIQYTDDFTTAKYLGDYTSISSVTHDAGNDELDIADTGYISYTFDCKGIVTGIPTLTGTIDITAGAPTIQISSNGSTWYDIDTATVDDVSTVYELDNAVNLQLDGLTLFYVRFDCDGAGTNTCSMKTFTLDVNIVTIDFENPVINTGGANTFRCDQDSDSGLQCEVSLVYEHRKYGG